MSASFHYPHALVTTDWLAERAADEDLRIFECTTYLRAPEPGVEAPYKVESGRADFEQGHIPGAAFLDLQVELSDNTSPSHLRFTMPRPEALASALGRRGVSEGTRVVLYARGAAQWATRVWWMMRAIGFDNVAILDGGWEKWTLEGRPRSTEEATYPPGTLTAKPRSGCFADKEEVKAAIGDGGSCTINALSADLHTGETNRYGRRGRIPGSVNVPAAALTPSDDKTFVDAATANAVFEAVGADPAKRIIVYCGGGIAATLDAFLLWQLGYEDIGVYDASMSEWAKDQSLAMETG